jgi:hypothetical protein
MLVKFILKYKLLKLFKVAKFFLDGKIRYVAVDDFVPS